MSLPRGALWSKINDAFANINCVWPFLRVGTPSSSLKFLLTLLHSSENPLRLLRDTALIRPDEVVPVKGIVPHDLLVAIRGNIKSLVQEMICVVDHFLLDELEKKCEHLHSKIGKLFCLGIKLTSCFDAT
jgi:hypothetical protein